MWDWDRVRNMVKSIVKRTTNTLRISQLLQWVWTLYNVVLFRCLCKRASPFGRCDESTWILVDNSIATWSCSVAALEVDDDTAAVWSSHDGLQAAVRVASDFVDSYSSTTDNQTSNKMWMYDLTATPGHPSYSNSHHCHPACWLIGLWAPLQLSVHIVVNALL